MYSYFKMRKTTFGGMSETHGRDISSGGSATGEDSGVLLLIPHVSVVPSTVEGDENTGIISGIPVADVIMV